MFAEHSQYKNIHEEMSGYGLSCQSEKLSPSVMRELTLGFYRNSHNLVLNHKPIMSLIEQYFLMTGAVYDA